MLHDDVLRVCRLHTSGIGQEILVQYVISNQSIQPGDLLRAVGGEMGSPGFTGNAPKALIVRLPAETDGEY